MFKGFTSEAHSLLEGLQSSLHNQEEKLSAFTQQQRNLHSRSIESAKSVSEVMLDFFKTLDTHACKLTKLAEDAQNVNEQKLSAFTKKFEVGFCYFSLSNSTTQAFYNELCFLPFRNQLQMKRNKCLRKWQSY